MKGADEDYIATLSLRVLGLPNWTRLGGVGGWGGTRPSSRHQQAIQACLQAEVVTMTLPRAGARVPFPDQQSSLREKLPSKSHSLSPAPAANPLSGTQLRNIGLG